MRYLSVCSGIEAASTAWMPLGWEPVAFSEIEPFPCSVLAHHHPTVPNWGDMTKFEEWPDVPIDLLCGGTPCQSFSIAGLRKGLADPRGNLMLTFGAIAAKYRPRWLVWENVPGVLSSNGGRDFGSFLGLLAELGYGFAYRVLDAQYVRVESHPRAVPQRRRRVFVVGHSGGLWQRAAAVLFERESLCGHPAPSRKTGQNAAADAGAGAAGSGLGTDFDCDGGLIPSTAQCLTTGTGQRYDPETETETILAVTRTLRGEGFDASEDGTGRGTPIAPVSVAIRGRDGGAQIEVGDDVAFTLRASSGGGDKPHVMAPVAFAENSRHEIRLEGGHGQRTGALSTGGGKPGQGVPMIAFPANLSGTQYASAEDVAPAMGATNPIAVAGPAIGWSEELTASVDLAGTLQRGGDGGRREGVMTPAMQVRRFTPVECMRLQGFPDGHTAITVKGKPAADGPQYKAIGNSWAINCARWIGERIESVERIEVGRDVIQAIKEVA